MPRKARFAGTPKEKNRYRQRVHVWIRKGLVEGKDFVVENGVPMRLRGPDGLPPKAGRPFTVNPPPQREIRAPTDEELVRMPAQDLVRLPYEASVRVALLRRKWDLEDATAHGISHPVQSLPPLPNHIQEEIRYVGDLVAAYLSKHHPHPYGSEGQ